MVVPLRAEDIQHGVNFNNPVYDEIFREPIEATFRVREIQLPSEIFHEHDDYDAVDGAIIDILDNLPYALAGGKPIWLQGERYHDDVLVQFDDNFIDMNLGDGGLMYVYCDTVFMN